MKIVPVCILAFLGLGLVPTDAPALTINPFYAGVYTATDLGPVPGVPSSYGGLNIVAGDPNTLIIGGDANTAPGALYSIGVTRGSGGHITGFSGTATRVADAAFNDGGVVYGPGGVLFLARWPVNQLGENKPGSTTTDKIIPLDGTGFGNSAVDESLSAFNFVPPGFPGAGRFKMVTWPSGQWAEGTLAPDGTGTFNLTSLTLIPTSNLPGGPEGFIYVPTGSPLFGTPSMLVSEFSVDKIAAYDVDANGDPIVATRRDFLTGTTTLGSGPEGAFIDPVTGDFLFSTFADVANSKLIVVQGFVAPPPVPEPHAWALVASGLAGLAMAALRRRIV